MRPFKALLTATAAAAVAVIATGLTVGSGSVSAEAETIRIGDINSYTRLPAHTVPYRQGAILAIEEINSAGGVLGRQLEFISHDDQGKPGEAVKVAERLFDRDEVTLISGSLFSPHRAGADRLRQADPATVHRGRAAGRRAGLGSGQPLHTFRLRPSTYMQAAMLAAEGSEERGRQALGNHRAQLCLRQGRCGGVPEGVDGVATGCGVRRLAMAGTVQDRRRGRGRGAQGAWSRTRSTTSPSAAISPSSAREGRLRDLFEGRLMVGLLTGEPEYLDPLKDEAPEGWLVTGYPWYDIDTPAHDAFLAAYQQRWDDYPRIGSVVGYNTMLAIKAMLERAGSTDTEKMVDAMEGLSFDAPTGAHHLSGDRSSVDNGGLCRLRPRCATDRASWSTGNISTARTTCRRMTRSGNCAAETEAAERQGPGRSAPDADVPDKGRSEQESRSVADFIVSLLTGLSSRRGHVPGRVGIVDHLRRDPDRELRARLVLHAGRLYRVHAGPDDRLHGDRFLGRRPDRRRRRRPDRRG